MPISEELHYQLLRAIERNPEMTQRQIAKELGLSLGKVNYCLKALLDKGWVVAENFRNSPNKRGYAYFLTPKGVEGKARVTVRFLKRKLQEHEEIQTTIVQLREEVARAGTQQNRSATEI